MPTVLTMDDLTAPAIVERLARDFPRIPERIIASVAEAYHREIPDAAATIAAARTRLRDACAI